MDRREFLIGAGAVAAAAALPVASWISPFAVEEGLPIGAIVYDTFEGAAGRVTYAYVVNGRCHLPAGWHYDLHGILDAVPAFPGQPLGPSCRRGEVFEL